MNRKAKQLSDVAINELSLVFAQKDGAEWAPRNREAMVLGTKAAQADVGGAQASESAKAGFLDKLATVIKGWYTDGPVVGDVPDNIDHDGDGASDYNGIVALITSMYYDLQSATCVQDDKGRSAGVVAIIDSFLSQLDALRAGSEDASPAAAGKAGKRHSAADQAHIDAIAIAHDKLGKALAAATKAHDAIDEHVNGLQPGAAPDDESEADDSEKADKEPYGEVDYADPGYQEDKEKRYPIDTKAHAKSAWSYINKESNAAKYSAEDLAKVKAKIEAACKKFGIEISDDSKAGPAASVPDSQEIDMTQEQLDAAIAKAATEAAAKAVETVRAELQPQIDAAKGAQAVAEAALNAVARTPSAGGVDENARKFKASGSLERALKAANSGTILTVQGRGEA